MREDHQSENIDISFIEKSRDFQNRIESSLKEFIKNNLK